MSTVWDRIEQRAPARRPRAPLLPALVRRRADPRGARRLLGPVPLRHRGDRHAERRRRRPSSPSTPSCAGHADEEAAHVAMWDGFVDAVGGDVGAEPNAETARVRRDLDRKDGALRAARPPLRDRERPAGDLEDQDRGPRRPLRDRRRPRDRVLHGPREADVDHADEGRELIERADRTPEPTRTSSSPPPNRPSRRTGACSTESELPGPRAGPAPAVRRYALSAVDAGLHSVAAGSPQRSPLRSSSRYRCRLPSRSRSRAGSSRSRRCCCSSLPILATGRAPGCRTRSSAVRRARSAAAPRPVAHSHRAGASSLRGPPAAGLLHRRPRSRSAARRSPADPPRTAVGPGVDRLASFRMSRTDRAIGIGIGLVIGLVALILFVFGGSGQTIDAPSLDHSTPAGSRPPAPEVTPRRRIDEFERNHGSSPCS